MRTPITPKLFRVRKSMARIKYVVNERRLAYEGAVKIFKDNWEAGLAEKRKKKEADRQLLADKAGEEAKVKAKAEAEARREAGTEEGKAASLAARGVAGGTQGPNAYCKNLVLKRDYQAFLTSQTFPEEHRGAVFALRAFYVELATIQESVSSSVIGKMRMQFWRDAVKGFPDGRPPQHPIALALYEAYQKAKLPTYHLKRIIDARSYMHPPISRLIL
ncbi:hypothetical protein EW026_g1175 [Hermanssonia centrifuga]|uniref:Uncharacterized protein n=1 Tax=Hermanssonia centrifuga TaxID=98765 RepID=A0A4S4KSF8_9APHY|nr:hypothetical protein EW026_g1175 [Hermanssonia centrifuga]